ncbi:MAG: response regulator [Desulfurivibrionaceae bacterium]
MKNSEAETGLKPYRSIPTDELLYEDETILIVDDDPHLRQAMSLFFERQELPVTSADTAERMFSVLNSQKVALVLLDIKLPDADGMTLIPRITDLYPDTSIVMLSGIEDLNTALDCMRQGAEDYLNKPVHFNQVIFLIEKTLKKRHLAIDNRMYQKDLEQAQFRIKLLHDLSLKINSVYLGTKELDEILLALLVGITAKEGLRFNRAFLALFDEKDEILEGQFAIGPDCKSEAEHIWENMQRKDLDFFDIIAEVRPNCLKGDSGVNKIIKSLKISAADKDNILVRAALEHKSFKVINGKTEDGQHPLELIELLDIDNFVIAPLFSLKRPIGVIIADNYVTEAPVTESHLNLLELFASQASLAIEQSRMSKEMEEKIERLKELTYELDRNKDLLIQSECYSAVGRMAAQVGHIIRNPITSIGGISRILAKKSKDSEIKQYIEVITNEVDHLENAISEILDFTTPSEAVKQKVHLNNLIHKTLILLQTSMDRQGITWETELVEPDPLIYMDSRQIQQGLLNIFNNCIEAMPDGGVIQVASRIEDEHVIITISDTGAGLPTSFLSHVKEPFFSTKMRGTGLGLTMLERFLRENKGSFRLLHGEKGVTVEILLPLAQED